MNHKWNSSLNSKKEKGPKRPRPQISGQEIDPDVIYMTVKELAKIVGFSVNVVQKDIRDGKLKAIMKAYARTTRYYIHPNDSDSYIKEKAPKK
ncbi:MAG: helix-turn-helix domain-containing protein [Desulfobacterales bacterium]